MFNTRILKYFLIARQKMGMHLMKWNSSAMQSPGHSSSSTVKAGAEIHRFRRVDSIFPFVFLTTKCSPQLSLKADGGDNGSRDERKQSRGVRLLKVGAQTEQAA